MPDTVWQIELVDYATGSISNQLFVSRYQLYIPDKEVSARELKLLIEKESKND